jgi:membrane-associated protein
MVIISATLVAKNPELSSRLSAAGFLGAYFSDLICYSLNRFAGPKLLRQPVFARMIKRERIEKKSMIITSGTE